MNIETIREKISTLESQRRAITAQPRSREEVEIILAQTLAHFEITAAANMARTVAQIAAGQTCNPFTVAGNTAHGPVTLDLGPMFSNLLGTKVLLQSMQAALKSVPEGLAPKAKTKALAGLDYDLDALFTAEESAVRQSEIDGNPVQRRADVLPQYVLAQ